MFSFTFTLFFWKGGSCMRHFSLLSLHLRERERGFVRRNPYLTSAVKSTSFTEVCTADLLRHSGLNLCVLWVHSHVHQSGNATEQLNEHERKCKETVKTSINQVINEVWRGKKWPINEVSVTKCGMCWEKLRAPASFNRDFLSFFFFLFCCRLEQRNEQYKK